MSERFAGHLDLSDLFLTGGVRSECDVGFIEFFRADDLALDTRQQMRERYIFV